MVDKNADASAIAAFFTEKVRTKLPFIEIIDHYYDPTDDKCFITIGMIRQTINLEVFKGIIQKETSAREVVLHTRDRATGFIIELNGDCRVIFLRRFHSPSNFKNHLFDLFIFLFMAFLIWMVLK